MAITRVRYLGLLYLAVATSYGPCPGASQARSATHSSRSTTRFVHDLFAVDARPGIYRYGFGPALGHQRHHGE